MKLRQKVELSIGKAWIHSSALLEQIVHGVSIDMLSSELVQNPYPKLNALREKRPIHYAIGPKIHWVTPFNIVQEVLRDKRFGADVRKYEARVKNIEKRMSEQDLEVFNNPSMLDLDPPDHSRIRRLAQRGFLHNFIQSLEPKIREIVRNCFAQTANMEHWDVIEALAKPLPATVIAEMMGLPEKDHAQFQTWGEDLINSTGTNDSDKIIKGQQSSRALRKYFRDIIRERRGTEGADLIHQLIEAEEAGDKLTEIELYNTCLLLLVAGHETTTRLIGNGLYLLLTHPKQLAWLRENPDGIPNAIEEMLRFEPAVQATRRFVTEDLEFHGTQFKRGDLLFLSIAAANRDPEANDHPETFDIRRKNIKQVSFGYGIHLCIGASLARLETRVVFEELLQAFPEMSLVDKKATWGGNFIFRGHDRLPISVSSRAE